MTIPLFRQYPTPGPGELGYFHNLGHFRSKLEKHVLDEREPWGDALPPGLLNLTVTAIQQGAPWLENAYEKWVDMLHGEVMFSVTKPVFVGYKARRINRSTRNEAERKGHYFLARKGYLIVARGEVVCTAYFLRESRYDTDAKRFQMAWEKVRDKLDGGTYYDSDSGDDVTFLEVDRQSREHWERCPDPADGPRSQRPDRPLPPNWQQIHRTAERHRRPRPGGNPDA